MRRFLFFVLFSGFLISTLFAQPVVREFRLGLWGMFPWVEPNTNEKDRLEEINTNHINAWILNPNDAVYSNYPAYYTNFSDTGIVWLERRWMTYLDSTDIGMYVGYNGWRDSTYQYRYNQIEYFAKIGNTSAFRNVFTNYHTTFGDDAGLQGYYVSHEDARHSYYRDEIQELIDYIRANDTTLNHEIVITEPTVDSLHGHIFTDLDVFEGQFYYFRNSDPYSSVSEQHELDEVVDEAEKSMNHFAGTSTDWHPFIQTYIQVPITPKIARPEVSAPTKTSSWDRWPSREEMFASAYLCLTRGARGIKTFLYGSTITKQSTELQGLMTADFTGGNRPKREILINGTPYEPFEFVKELFTELRIIKDIFPQIEVESAYTASAGTSGVFVTTTGNWIEAGVFHNRITPDPDQKIRVIGQSCL